MELSELYRRLSYGELQNIHMGMEGAGTIVTAAKPRIIAYANEALLRLHSRFLLRESVLVLEQVDHLAYYYLIKRFARSQETVPNNDDDGAMHHYILDSEEEPFQDDVIKVLSITNSESCPIPLNDTEDHKSLFTPQPNLLQIPEPKGGDLLAVQYQARHPLLGYGEGCQLIDLPFVLEGALTAFIAHKVFFHMNGQDNKAIAADHLATYESICGEVTEMDTVSQTQVATPMKFNRRGFV
jgi:hypothetical protein